MSASALVAIALVLIAPVAASAQAHESYDIPAHVAAVEGIALLERPDGAEDLEANLTLVEGDRVLAGAAFFPAVDESIAAAPGPYVVPLPLTSTIRSIVLGLPSPAQRSQESVSSGRSSTRSANSSTIASRARGSCISRSARRANAAPATTSWR